MNMVDSPFGSLPPELRVKIFEYVLYSPEANNVFEFDDKGPRSASWMTANNRRALTAVCSQIRTESFPICYRFDKIQFQPRVLDKYVPGSFLMEVDKQHMIWNYLRPLENWTETFSEWLDHMGDDTRKNIKTVDIHVGVWTKGWFSTENPLIVCLNRNLVGIVKLFEGSGTEVNLCCGLHDDTYWAKVVDVSLPLTDMPKAYETLESFVEQLRGQRSSLRWGQLSKEYSEHLNYSYEQMCIHLAFLEDGIKQSNEGRGVDQPDISSRMGPRGI